MLNIMVKNGGESMQKVLLDNVSISVDTKGLNSFISAVSIDIEKDFLYDGLSNQEILDFHPDEKIYQFDESAINVYSDSLDLEKTQTGYCLYSFDYSKNKYLLGETSALMTGRIEQALLNEDIIVRAFISGGRFKKVVLNDDGSDRIKTYRDPYTIKLAIVQEKEKTIEYVPSIVEQIKQGQTYYCNNCKSKLAGERICPNCGQTIFYPNENGKSNFLKAAEGLEKAGDSLSKTGRDLTLGCTIPILLLIILGALIF